MTKPDAVALRDRLNDTAPAGVAYLVMESAASPGARTFGGYYVKRTVTSVRQLAQADEPPPATSAPDVPKWWDGRLVGFDLETTSPQPEDARIVTAALVEAGGGEPVRKRTWLINPGVEIPAEATAVHGITNERVIADGMPAAEALAEIAAALRQLPAGAPLVIFNARYDCTVGDREFRRHGLATLAELLPDLRVIDPSVIDKVLDRFRRSYPGRLTPEQAKERAIPSSRTLTGMCLHYGAKLDEAHDAAFDALAACRLAWVMGVRGRAIRNRPGEAAPVQAEWDEARVDLTALHEAQRRWALDERERFAEYKRSIGETDMAERIEAERDWPILDVMPHEPWA